jgi:hypothetical protein
MKRMNKTRKIVFLADMIFLLKFKFFIIILKKSQVFMRCGKKVGKTMNKWRDEN